MNTLTWIFFITLGISAFCAAMAGVFYFVKEIFFIIWKVDADDADGLFWKFLDKGVKVLLSIAVWLLILVGISGGLLLVWIALYAVLSAP